MANLSSFSEFVMEKKSYRSDSRRINTPRIRFQDAVTLNRMKFMYERLVRAHVKIH